MSDNRPPSPPPPPPPPPPPSSLPPPPPDLQSKVSPVVLKLRSAPPGRFHQSSNPPPVVDLSDPPTGPYFFYGTLMDPRMLSDILELEHEPTLRPANIVGYACKLWGQYPVVQDGPQGAVVKGAVYHVQSVADGRRLAEYETKNYSIKPCLIQYADGGEPADDRGHVFMFAGDPQNLTEGAFDLGTWLKRMGREPALQN